MNKNSHKQTFVVNWKAFIEIDISNFPLLPDVIITCHTPVDVRYSTGTNVTSDQVQVSVSNLVTSFPPTSCVRCSREATHYNFPSYSTLYEGRIPTVAEN